MGRSAMVGNDFVISNSQNKNESEKVEIPAIEPVQKIVMPRESSEYNEPYQNFGTLAYNSPATGQPSFALPSISDAGSRFLGRVKIIPLVTAVVVAGLMVGTLVYKQQIISRVSKAEVAVSEAEQVMTGHRAAPPAPNPRQLVIQNSDYDAALTALMTDKPYRRKFQPFGKQYYHNQLDQRGKRKVVNNPNSQYRTGGKLSESAD
jgi:hypothetical protein